MKIKQRIFQLVEKGSYGSKINLLFDYFIIALIILNVIAIALDTLSGLPGELRNILKAFEIASIGIFTVEYILRIYVSELTHPAKSKFGSAIKFMISPFGIIDLLAILPFYIPFIITVDLRYLRILRLVRLLRVLKINRYNTTLKLIKDVLKEKRAEIGMIFFVTLLLLLVSGFITYSVENPVQPDKFPDIFSSLWCAVATLTSIGYGDVYPITTIGKITSGVVAVLGIGLVAIPTGILSAGFMEKTDKNKNDKKPHFCPHCGEKIELK
jgi:voltage-gated potassium channel